MPCQPAYGFLLSETFRHLFVLHGHLHAAVNRVLGCGVPRIFGATAVVDDRDAPRVHLYDVRGGALVAADLAGSSARLSSVA